MDKKTYFKIFGYGLQLFVVVMLLIFAMSAITNSDQIDHWWEGVVIAILMAGCSWLYSLRLKPTTTKEKLTYGITWAIMIAVIILIITIPNKTTGIVFGSWSAYLIFLGVAVGPIVGNYKSVTPKIG
ncbi:MAG: hypothetical protein WCT08_04250 [Patescibacteria group bacterium]|jgi:hypothetical protein